MKKGTKNDLFAAILYIILAVMVVTTVSVAVLSVANRAKEKNGQTLPSEVTLPSKEKPADEPTNAPTEPATEPTEPETQPSEPAKDVSAEEHDVAPSVFSVPVTGHISKGYEDELPVWSVTMEDYRTHEGIDVCCEVGAQVFSCADGVVESVSEDPLMGNTVTVYHGGGLRSIYMNMSDDYPQNTKVGTPVTAGQVIGYVGESALIECAEVPHLHFAMTLSDKSINPLDYVVYEGTITENTEWED